MSALRLSLLFGTRGSALALAQTRLVIEALGGVGETRVVRTTGDVSSIEGPARRV